MNQFRKVEQAFTTDLSAYLERLAKVADLRAEQIGDRSPGRGCRCWAVVGECDEGHRVARAIDCGREWCSECGIKDSPAHVRRWIRWFPKARQCATLGYLVVTFPPVYREKLRSKAELRDMTNSVIAGLKDLGFGRGLSRWHWFGDMSTRFHPHMNFILESGFIEPDVLQAIHALMKRITRLDCVIYYQYTDNPAIMMHLLKYVTRPTFLVQTWDYYFSLAIKGFRNCRSWGIWNDAPEWGMDQEARRQVGEDVALILASACPFCHNPVTWQRSISRLSSLLFADASPIGGSCYVFPPPE